MPLRYDEQLFDEGRLTDGKGTTIECKNAIFVMTSNLAATEIAEHGLQLRREAEEIAGERAKGTLEETKMEERITISRHFKDKGRVGWVPSINILLASCANLAEGPYLNDVGTEVEGGFFPACAGL